MVVVGYTLRLPDDSSRFGKLRVGDLVTCTAVTLHLTGWLHRAHVLLYFEYCVLCVDGRTGSGGALYCQASHRGVSREACRPPPRCLPLPRDLPGNTIHHRV